MPKFITKNGNKIPINESIRHTEPLKKGDSFAGGIVVKDTGITERQVTPEELERLTGRKEKDLQKLTDLGVNSNGNAIETESMGFRTRTMAEEHLKLLKSGRINGVHDPQREDMIKHLEKALTKKDGEEFVR